MIEQKPSSIGEAPSLDDITSSADERVGRVDFSTQLGRDATAAPASTGAISLARVTTPERQLGQSAPAADETSKPQHDPSRPIPLILPPAKIDEAMAAEAARIQREIAEARGEKIEYLVDAEGEEDVVEETRAEAAPDHDAPATDDEATDDEATETDHDTDASDETAVPETRPVTAEAPAPTPPTTVEPTPRPRLRRTKTPTPPAAAPLEPQLAPASERLQIQDVASLEDIAAQAAHAEAAAAAAAALAEERATARREEAAAAAAVEQSAYPALDAATIEDIDDLLGDDLDEDYFAPETPARATARPESEQDVAVDQSVAEVAASVIAAMRAIGAANERHLEAIELEAARRCELLTAQAELDAELIRLHARREAHATISAARRRAGEDLTPVETDQLSEIGETFSRFAETIETTIASGPASPDTTRKS